MSLDRLLSHLQVSVHPFSLCILSGGWRLRLPAPTGPLLHFVLRGTGRIVGPRRDHHTLAPFTLAVVPLGSTHALESTAPVRRETTFDARNAGPPVFRIVAGSAEDPDLTIACGVIAVRYGHSLGLFDHLDRIVTVDLVDVPQVRDAFDTILAEQGNPQEGAQTLTGALMTASIVYLFRRLLVQSAGTLPWLQALEHPNLGRAIDAMLEDPGQPHTVESLADIAAMSRSAFAEQFGRAFKRPPMAMLHRIRMETAARLLHEGALTMSDVARRVGFSSRSHFSTAFRKHHGVPPTSHRVAT